MAASLSFISLTPQTLSLHHSSPPSAVSASSLLAPSSLKPLPKLVISLASIGNHAHSASRFVRNVSISSEVEEQVQESEDDGFDSEPNFSPELKLFVGNLPFSVDSSGLLGLFEQAGNVEMVEVIYDKASGRSRGFGFVTMSTVKEVEAATQQFNGYEFQGRILRVNSGPAPPKRESFDRSPPPRRESFSSRGPKGVTSFDSAYKIHVGNLAWGVDDLSLETLFNEHGKVKEATVVYDRESGRSRGFGFVTYSSAEEVENAISSLDGIDLNGRSIRVSRAEARARRDY